MEKVILVKETEASGEVIKQEKTTEEELTNYLVKKRGMSEEEARETVEKLLSGEMDKLTLRELRVKRKIIER